MFSKSALLKSALQIERNFPENLREADRTDFDEYTRYMTCNAFLRPLADVSLSSDSVIYTGLSVDSESLYSPRLKAYYQTRHLAKKLFFGKKVALDRSSNYLLATDYESSGHFHWLTEVLPRLWLIRDQASEFVLLLPDTSYIRSIGLESLRLLGFDFADVVWMRDDEFFKVPSLFHITKVSNTGLMHDGIMKELRAAFVGRAPGGSKKIYISRANAERRKVLNENELLPTLRNYGFETFTGEGASLTQQIELFSECCVIAGIHGAGLTNCLFMQPGTVIELRKREPNHGYWQLSGSLGHKYYYYNGIPDSDLSLIGRGCNLTIPIDNFETEILEKIT